MFDFCLQFFIAETWTQRRLENRFEFFHLEVTLSDGAQARCERCWSNKTFLNARIFLNDSRIHWNQNHCQFWTFHGAFSQPVFGCLRIAQNFRIIYANECKLLLSTCELLRFLFSSQMQFFISFHCTIWKRRARKKRTRRSLCQNRKFFCSSQGETRKRAIWKQWRM